MKNILFICVVLITFMSCTSKPFTGYIVDKEYISGHRCHTSGYKKVHQASFVPGVVVVNHHHHKWVKCTVTVWVANRHEIRPFSVDTTSYTSWVLGKKITFK